MAAFWTYQHYLPQLICLQFSIVLCTHCTVHASTCCMYLHDFVSMLVSWHTPEFSYPIYLMIDRARRAGGEEVGAVRVGRAIAARPSLHTTSRQTQQPCGKCVSTNNSRTCHCTEHIVATCSPDYHNHDLAYHANLWQATVQHPKSMPTGFLPYRVHG